MPTLTKRSLDDKVNSVDYNDHYNSNSNKNYNETVKLRRRDFYLSTSALSKIHPLFALYGTFIV